MPKRPVAMIGTYVPRRCGIATFTHDLATGLSQTLFDQPLTGGSRVGIVAVSDDEKDYAYGPQVVHTIRHHSKEDYRAAADFLNHSKYEVVSVQHEYGIFGGDQGQYLLALVERLTKPFITTLHTVLGEPTPIQKTILEELCNRSGAVTVMAARAQRMIQDIYDIPADKVHMIHHGVPDVPFGDTAQFKGRFEVTGRPTILTFGLLSPNKGVEMMLEALARVVPEFPDVAYIVLGATHPMVRRESGESYRLSLEKLAVTLGIQDNVSFHNLYVSLDDLCEYLQAADIYVTSYRTKQQIVSGTLAYAVGCGTAVISTPYWYAEEILANNRGRLVDFGDVDGLAQHLRELLANDTVRQQMRKRAYDFGRQMTWHNVATQYGQLFDKVSAAHVTRAVPSQVRPKPALRLSLPEARLDHLYRMTDDTGLIQHAVNSTPDRRHGYSIDDVARGLIVAAMRYSLFRDEQVLRPFHTYLSFIHHARCEDGKFRNFMSYDRRWLESVGSDDCQGRVLWALGYVVAHPPDDLSQQLCRTLFEQTTPIFQNIRFVRAISSAILGCHYYLRRFPDASHVEHLMHSLTESIVAQFGTTKDDEWPWFDESATYDNARIPQALILAGYQFNDDELLQRGLRSLDWLLRIQTGDDGQISLIGNKGWLRRGEPKANFDQQPVEIAALIGACKAAYRATDDSRYLAEMRRCFDWFLGSNDIGHPLIDFKSRGCYDGLKSDGVNLNQGAESLLAWLLSLLIMHEMQSGDPTSAG